MGCNCSCARKIVISISRGLQVLAILGLSNSLLSFSSTTSSLTLSCPSSTTSYPTSYPPFYPPSYPTFSSLLLT